MNLLKSMFVLPFAIAIISFVGCASVPTTAVVNETSTAISYYAKQGRKPTVVFESGLGDGKDVWQKVIAKMPDGVAIFAYDRPGYGDSPGTVEPRDPCNIARELQSALSAAKIEPPYVLVGHSLGGLYMFSYAKLYPENVAGLVLLDPTHLNHWARMKNDAPTQAALVKGLKSIAFTKVMRQEFDDQEGCLDTLDLTGRLPMQASFLFSGQFRLEELGAFEQMVRELRKQWPQLFVNAQSEEISGSGHYIQRDAPGNVIQAIQSVIAGWQVTNKNFIR